MANTKLSNLTEATTLGPTDELYVNDSGTSKRITVANASAALASGIRRNGVAAAALGYMDLFHGTHGSSANDEMFGGDGYYIPFIIDKAVTLSGLGLECTIAGATNKKVAILNPTSGNLPGAALSSTLTFDLSSTGWKTASFATAVTLTPGVYYLAQKNDASTTARIRCSATNANAVRLGMTAPGTNLQSDTVGWILNTSTSYAAWPPATQVNSAYGTDALALPWIVGIVTA